MYVQDVQHHMKYIFATTYAVRMDAYADLVIVEKLVDDVMTNV
jgi:hypothetical protein